MVIFIDEGLPSKRLLEDILSGHLPAGEFQPMITISIGMVWNIIGLHSG